MTARLWVNDWLEDRATWQFAAVYGLCLFIGTAAATAGIDWAMKGHLELEFPLVFAAAFTAVITAPATYAQRQRQPGPSTSPPRRPNLAGGVPETALQVEPLTKADIAPAVELAVRVLGVKPGDRGEQFAADITGERRQMFVAKADAQVVGYGRVLELAADEAAEGTPAGFYLSGVLVEQAWRRRGYRHSADPGPVALGLCPH